MSTSLLRNLPSLYRSISRVASKKEVRIELNGYSLIASLPFPISIIDASGCISSTNQSFLDCFDNSKDSISFVNRNILDVILPKDHDKIFSNIKRMHQSEVERIDIGVCALKNPMNTMETYEIVLTKGQEEAIILSIVSTKPTSRNNSPLPRSSSSSPPLSPSPPNSPPSTNSPRPSRRLSLRSQSVKLTSNDAVSSQSSKSSTNDAGDAFAEAEIRGLVSKSTYDGFVRRKTKDFERSISILKSENLFDSLAMKRRLIRHFSHEIRSPLNVIMPGFMLLETMIEEPSAKQILDNMQCACVQAVDVLNDLIIYERLDSNQLVLDKAICNVASVVKEVVSSVNQHAGRLDVNLSTAIPDDCASILINADAVNLSIALRNIIADALRFTAAGGNVIVSVKLDSLKNRVCIEVKDSGNGVLSTKEQEMLYFETDELNTLQGKSIGMHVARGIIVQHGGEYSLDLIKQSAGSTVWATFPIATPGKTLSGKHTI
jgi:signal transduction histidine kinase